MKTKTVKIALEGFGSYLGIDCLFLTQKGRPVAMLRSLDDDSPSPI